MTILYVLIPVALIMGAFGLLAFLWSLRNGQYDDLSGAAERILLPEEEDAPLNPERRPARAAANPDSSKETAP